MWIMVDGQRVFSFNHYPYEWAEREAYWSGMNSEQVKDSLQKAGMQSPNDFGDAIREYLDMPVSQTLESTNPIIKAFALVDGRTGKRTIDKMLLSDSEHSLVKAFYELRISGVD